MARSTPFLSTAVRRTAAAAVLGLSFLLMWRSARSLSPTYDEVAVVGAGARYVGDGRFDMALLDYPPLAKYLVGAAVEVAGSTVTARPSFVADDRYYAHGFEVLFRNGPSPERLAAAARLPNILLFTLLAAAVGLWARRWWGEAGGALALVAQAFEPNVLANGALATTDAGLTAMLFLAAYAWVRYWESGRAVFLWGSGLAFGAAVAFKTPGLLFAAAAPLLAFAARPPGPADGAFWRRFGAAHAALAAGLWAVLFVVYRGHPIAYFGPQLKFSVGLGFQAGWRNYLHGAIRTEGFPHYYLVAILVKTPLPYLALLVFGVWRAARANRRALAVLAIPAAIVLIVFSLSSKQNGLRYVLPAYPFFSVLIGAAALGAGRRAAAAAALLAAWLPVEAAARSPHHLAYFNPLAGGPDQGHRWLIDCNLDWGQDLPALRDYWQKAGRPALLLATAGVADREHYFGPQQDVTKDDHTPPWLYYRHVNPEDPPREWLIVAASKLHGWGVSGDPFAALRGRRPLAQPGHASFVFDVTRDPETHFALGVFYQAQEAWPQALRQFRRAARLAPSDPLPLLAQGDTLLLTGRSSEARSAYARARAVAAPGTPAAKALARRLRDPRLRGGR